MVSRDGGRPYRFSDGLRSPRSKAVALGRCRAVPTFGKASQITGRIQQQKRINQQQGRLRPRPRINNSKGIWAVAAPRVAGFAVSSPADPVVPLSTACEDSVLDEGLAREMRADAGWRRDLPRGVSASAQGFTDHSRSGSFSGRIRGVMDAPMRGGGIGGCMRAAASSDRTWSASVDFGRGT